ncbi:MAG TPA: outer membrane beta-barrel protein, partial [Flavisolibacter sp.]|nr:outer membrane beta-barrel protein [Flavisolibacter sp.]
MKKMLLTKTILLNLFITAIFLFLTSALSAQTVKGKISDTLEHKSLQNAVVTLIQTKDSLLYKFTRTNKNGEFILNNVAPGKYIFLITYPKFADFSDIFEIKNQPENDLGNIPLTLKSKLLDAVVVKSAGAIRIKGDTTEFVADSFKLKEGATVEDLLKKLPGFQVNAKGEITAQGQKVDKVLVDGEEFFGNDPTIATQNIAAKVVDKVQVFDTKSEQQQLTGISNSTDGKTVNIKLKDSNKKGYFGKIYGGTDFDKYHDAKGLYNNFVGKRKISAYATKSNVNAGSLDWQDQQKLGLENDIDYDEIGGYYYSFGSSDEFSDWNLRGLPNSYTGGLLYGNKWNDERQNLNGSYRFNHLQILNDASTLVQNILQNTVNYRNKYVHSDVLNEQHAFNMKYEWKIDSLASLKFVSADIYKTSNMLSTTTSEFLDANHQRVNTSDQDRQNKTERKQSDNQLTYKQLFKKKDRLLLTTLRFGYVQDMQNGIIKTTSNFYKNNVLDSTNILDQLKLFNGESKTFGIKTTFSEPLSNKLTLIADYAYNQNNSNSNRKTFNKTNSGKYDQLDLVYSNNFDLNAYSNSGDLIFKYIDKKFRLSAGSGLSSVRLQLNNLYSNTKNAYDFLNITPVAQFAYSFKPQTRLSVSYRGTTIQPNINQLQPVSDNTDP